MNVKSTERRWALDYVTHDTNIVAAKKEEGYWVIEIAPNVISASWDLTDSIFIYGFKNYSELIKETNGSIIFKLSEDMYKTGDMLVVLFYNETKDEYKAAYINLSNSDKYIFGCKKAGERFCEAGIMDENSIEVMDKSDDEVINDLSLPKLLKSGEINAQIDTTGEMKKTAVIPLSAYSTTTTASTNFVIYNASGNVDTNYSSTKSPFEAIQKIVMDGKTNYTVRQSNDGKIVFKYMPNSRNTFYLFQYTNYYTSTTSISEVKSWCQGFLYTHSVRCDGYFGSNTSVIDSAGTNQPYAHSYSYYSNNPASGNESRLEGNTGAYVYKVAKKGSYVKATMIVNLSEATIHYVTDAITTFYSYINATNSTGGWFTCDIGVAMSLGAQGHMQMVVNASEDSDVEWSSNNHEIVTFNANGNTYTTSQDIKIYFEVTSGCYHAKIYNYTTAKTIEVWVNNSKINTSNTVFLNGTSLVPHCVNSDKQQVIPDIKCGAYAKNVPILYSRLYTSGQNWDGTGTEFVPNSTSVTDTTIIYDNDHASYSYNSSSRREVVNIDYTYSYKR